MSRDAHRSPGPNRRAGELPPGVAQCERLGARLSRASESERDLAWHVMAYHVGDFSALVSARLSAASRTGPAAG